MDFHHVSRRSAAFASLLVSGLLLSGCMASPTYGTGKPADEQLLEDLTGILSLAPKNDQRIEYKPRPELVVTPEATATLPQPQQSVASAENPAWPESPEERRARIRAEVTASRDNPGFEPLVENDIAVAETSETVSPGGREAGHRATGRTNYQPQFVGANSAAQREEFNRRLAVSKQGSPANRRFLSEPPLDYRVPAATAPAGDIGEDEWEKEKRLKAEARKRAGKSSWADALPW